MNTYALVQELKRKLEDAVQESKAHKERIDYHQSELNRLTDLADSIHGVIRGLGIDAEVSAQKSEPIAYSGREPRDLKKPEFSRKGYIAFSIEDLLPKYPSGASIDELINDGFDYNTEEEFEKIKKSYAVELNRAFREERIHKDENENFFLLENKPPSQDFLDSNTTGVEQVGVKSLGRLITAEHIKAPQGIP